jgi:anti-sigma regulatory factor (Ser/Thr protein kinase)
MSERPAFASGAASGTAARDWPLQSYLELAAFPSAVPCVRLHARQLLWEWGLRALAETTELVISELATNAIKASADIDRVPPSAGHHGVSCIAVLLASDRKQVLVNIWDSNPRPPKAADADENAEAGRGLLLVDALCEQWSWYMPKDGHNGKWVWAIIAPH